MSPRFNLPAAENNLRADILAWLIIVLQARVIVAPTTPIARFLQPAAFVKPDGIEGGTEKFALLEDATLRFLAAPGRLVKARWM